MQASWAREGKLTRDVLDLDLCAVEALFEPVLEGLFSVCELFCLGDGRAGEGAAVRCRGWWSGDERREAGARCGGAREGESGPEHLWLGLAVSVTRSEAVRRRPILASRSPRRAFVARRTSPLPLSSSSVCARAESAATEASTPSRTSPAHHGLPVATTRLAPRSLSPPHPRRSPARRPPGTPGPHTRHRSTAQCSRAISPDNAALDRRAEGLLVLLANRGEGRRRSRQGASRSPHEAACVRSEGRGQLDRASSSATALESPPRSATADAHLHSSLCSA